MIDLDARHWEAGGVAKKRDEGEARQLVAAAATQEKWIIERVHGWLAAVAATRATCFVWLDMPWTSCRDGLAARGLRRGATPADFDALLKWAEAYWERTSPSSFSGHLAMFEAFPGHKIRLKSRLEVDDFGRPST